MILSVALLVEFIGSFIFYSVILASGEAIPVAIALLAAIYFGGHLSGGSFNPAVTVIMMLNNKLTTKAGLMYIAVQLLAGFTAYAWSLFTLKQKATVPLF